MQRLYIFIGYFILPAFVIAQADTVVLEEMIFYPHHRTERKLIQSFSIEDSSWRHQTNQLFDVLQYNSTAHLRSNGLGMVSSISMRGSTAQQTSILWNGIPVNSKLLGQTDANTLSLPEFSTIQVIAGGNSMTHGSGAIGGVVEIEQKNIFHLDNSAHIQMRAGSFGLLEYGSGFTWSNLQNGFQFFVKSGKAENQFHVPKVNYENLNGETYYFITGGQAVHQFNNQTQLSAHWQWTDEKRNFVLSGVGATPSARSSNHWLSLLKLQHRINNWSHVVSAAYSRESYDFYNLMNSATEAQNGDHVNSWLLRYDVQYHYTDKLQFKILSQANQDFANGFNTGIADIELRGAHIALQAEYQFLPKLELQTAVRKEFSNGFISPWLAQQRLLWSPTSYSQTQLSFSTNFRAPTLNDMFWQPGGNQNLQPEYAIQWELDQKFSYKNGNIRLSFFHNHIQDMIRWLPILGDIWSPVNTHHVKSKGIEAEATQSLWKDKIEIKALYAYTDARNLETGHFLTYVPKHKINLNLALAWKPWRLGVQNIWVSEQFTHTDNNPHTALNAYGLTNLSVGYNFSQTPLRTLTFSINNLLDAAYQLMPYRPMPGINFTTSFNFEI